MASKIINDSRHINLTINDDSFMVNLESYRSKDAILSFSRHGFITWEDGIFLGGRSNFRVWNNGTFKGGYFDAIWKGGNFESGYFNGLLSGMIIGNCHKNSKCMMSGFGLSLMEFSKIEYHETVIYPIIA